MEEHMEKESLILVDSNDKQLGFEDKTQCHIWPCKLHRAFSIFIFNNKNELLIVTRSDNKKTWPSSFWSNTCCSHPREDETLEEATQKRLQFEIGFQTPLKELFAFEYQAQFNEQWGEHEYDHVFIGKFNDAFTPNPDEVKEWKWMLPEAILKEMETSPDLYTPWFKIALPRVMDYLKAHPEF